MTDHAPDRRSIRLKGYDYSQAGAYFVTIVTQGRACLFGEIVDGEMHLNAAGRMVEKEWLVLADRFPGVGLDSFVVMPNHFHGIVTIEIVGASLVDAPCNGVSQDCAGTRAGTSPAPTLGTIAGAFKSITTHGYILGVRQDGWTPFDRRLWQRNYYEHILRDSFEWEQAAAYIQNNPQAWETDTENPLSFGN